MFPFRSAPGKVRKSVQSAAQILKEYEKRPAIRLSGDELEPDRALVRCFLYYLLPLWTAAGILDWNWHRKTDIEHTAGLRESLIHVLMFSEMGAPLLLGLIFKINAGSLLAMLSMLVAHEATAAWDVHTALEQREVKQREQHTHSLLEVLPLTAFTVAASLNWSELRSLFGVSKKNPDFRLRLKEKKIPNKYWLAMGGMVGALAAVYGNEVWRCWCARNGEHYDASCQPKQAA